MCVQLRDERLGLGQGELLQQSPLPPENGSKWAHSMHRIRLCPHMRAGVAQVRPMDALLVRLRVALVALVGL